jgi:hypothetical protein
MDLSTFAYTIGALELLIGIPLLFFPDKAAQWILQCLKDEVHARFLGALLFVLGFLVLVEGYRIGTDVEGFMRLIAWIVAIKGVFLCYQPKKAAELTEGHLNIPALRFLAGFFATVFAILFIMAGNSLA